MPSKPTRRVRTFRALQSAIAEATPVSIQLGADIAIGEAITIPERHEVNPNGYGFVKQGAGSILFQGALNAGHAQVFYGFSPGDVTGGLGCGVIRPVWWGVRAREAAPGALTSGTDHVGINCAIRTAASGAHGHLIELDAGYYHVGGPIDLSGSNCRVVGAGAHRTELWSTFDWTADWATDPVYGIASHGAMVWLGSAAPGTDASMNTGIEGVYLNCYYASLGNLTKRVSGVSSKGWVEEHSSILNVTVSYYSGYGFGFMSSATDTRVINGLLIDGFWLTQPVSATAFPIAIGRHCANAVVRSGTIDCSVQNPPPQFNGSPWPLCTAAVITDAKSVGFSSIHIEGVRFGFIVRDCNQLHHTHITGVEMLSFHDTGMTSSVAGFSFSPIAPNGDYWNYSTAVAIYGEAVATAAGWTSGSTTNFRSRVTVEGIVAENVKYLVRDPAMGLDLQNWNNGQLSQYVGGLTEYRRSNAWSPPNATWYWNVPPYAYGSFPADGKTYTRLTP